MIPRPPQQPPVQSSLALADKEKAGVSTYVVAGLLVFVTLLISGSLLLVRATVSVAQSLPPLSEHFADLACMKLDTYIPIQGPEVTYRKKCQGSPREPSHGCRWRRTCRQRDHAWERWGLSYALA